LATPRAADQRFARGARVDAGGDGTNVFFGHWLESKA
jgi:hypothetical protein